jgi:hypothetical protein
MIDTDKYEGHTEGKWKLHYDDSAVDGDYLDYGAQLDPVGALHPMLIADAQLIADAPLILEEVKRLRERLMLAESALGEVRACHEDGQGNLGAILEHYRDKEGVEMPNAFDEVIE